MRKTWEHLMFKNVPGNEDQFSSKIPEQASGESVDSISRERGSRRISHTLHLSLILADVVFTFGIYVLVVWLRNGPVFWDYWYNVSTAILMTAVVVMANAGVGAYSRNCREFEVRDVCEQMIAATGGFLCILVVFFFLPEPFKGSRSSILSTMAIAPLASLTLRYIVFRARRQVLGKRVILVIADVHSMTPFLEWMQLLHSTYEVHFISPVTGLVQSSPSQEDALAGMTMDEASAALSRNLEAIVIAEAPESLPVHFLNRLVTINFNSLPVYLLESFHAREWQTVPLSTVSARWALNEGFSLSQSATYSRLKRLTDILFATLSLILCSPVLLLVAILVKLDSRGPVIYRQQRVGLHERHFTIYKFRTMRVGSDKGPAYTSENDSRVTRLGSFLRKTRLDELPQMVNVLRGEMSLIGPRAEWNLLVSDYERNIPYYHLRHLVKPGITGWAQVNYSYGANIRDTQIKLSYDLYYVRYFSFMLDLSIIIKTVYVIVFGKGR